MKIDEIIKRTDVDKKGGGKWSFNLVLLGLLGSLVGKMFFFGLVRTCEGYTKTEVKLPTEVNTINLEYIEKVNEKVNTEKVNIENQSEVDEFWNNQRNDVNLK